MLLRRARDKKENNNTSPKSSSVFPHPPNMADYITYYLNFFMCPRHLVISREKNVTLTINFVFLLQKENTISYR